MSNRVALPIACLLTSFGLLLFSIGALATPIGTSGVAGTIVTMDFENVAPAGGQIVYDPNAPSTSLPATPYTEDGFTLTTNFDPTGITGIFDSAFISSQSYLGVGNGTDVFGFCAACFQTIVSLTANSGAPFSLLSLDAANINIGFLTPGESLVVTGNLMSGGTVVQALPLVLDTFTTFGLGAQFTNLASVTFAGSLAGLSTNIALDNIVLATGTGAISVPEPSTALLLGVGLLTLGFSRRQRRNWQRRQITRR